MAELADAPDLGSGGTSRAGSSPVIRSIGRLNQLPFLLNMRRIWRAARALTQRT